MLLLVTCVTDADQAPVADAGGEQVVVLPAPLVTVNGSNSTDDRKIVSYLWTRDKGSPAAGVCCCSLAIVRWNICFDVLTHSTFDFCFWGYSRLVPKSKL